MTETPEPIASAPRTLRVREYGTALLHHPRYNKGTAFTREERAAFGLDGLLPDAVSDLDTQVARIHASIQSKGDVLEQYIGLIGLQERNEVLFYRLLQEHLETYLPIIYTPTVGLATQRYSEIFRRARGIWITPRHMGRIREVLRNAPQKAPQGDVRLIVATDAERILGIGDQGAGGMAIPIGKLALYTVAAGIDPGLTLPVCLDVGTDNERLRAHPFYLGVRQPRLRGPQYDALVEEFVAAVVELFPRALLQWEDFKKGNAMRILERYRERIPSFNDDIQGTAAVALAGVLAGVHATGKPLVEHRFAILGAGGAGVGIAKRLSDAVVRAGVPQAEVICHLAVLDSRGLLVEGREYGAGEEYKQRLSWPAELAARHGLSASAGNDLAAVVAAFQPTVLIGVSGQAGAFTEAVVRRMGATVERPLILPLSNPTSQSEGRPEELLRWTEGRALVASGSPFAPVELGGQVHEIGQANNVYVFPGVGLGALVAEARQVTEGMMRLAAETLTAEVRKDEIASGRLYPHLGRLREVSRRIALAVATQAVTEEVAPRRATAELERRLAEQVWEPVYPRLEPRGRAFSHRGDDGGASPDGADASRREAKL